MNWSQLLTELNTRSIELSADEGELVVRAPEGVISPQLWHHIAHHKSALLQLLQTELQSARNSKLPRITPGSADRWLPFPLTPIQEAYWLGRNPVFELGRVGIHVYEELNCRNLDLIRLDQAWQKILDRHEMLRAVVLPDGRQQILPAVDYSVEIRDLKAFSPADQLAVLASLRKQLVQSVYDPQRFPLFNITACLLNKQETRLFISIDAINADMGSFAILFSDWSDLYEDPDKELPPLSLSYRDYALAVTALRRHQSFQPAREYWQSQVAVLPPAPLLPYACQFNALKTQNFVRQSGQLESSLWQQLKQKAAQSGITPSVIALTAFAEVIARWSQEQNFSLNVTLFNRLPMHPQVNQIVGDFTSMMPLPFIRGNGANFTERAVSLQKHVWDALDNRIVNGVEVLRDLRRSKQQSNLGQINLPVVFTSTLNLKQQGVLPLKKFGERVYNRIQTPQVSLDLQVYEEDGDLIYNWDAVDELFPPGMLEQMFSAYGQLLKNLVSDKYVWTDAEKELVAVTVTKRQAALNQTSKPVSGQMLQDLFARQVIKRPGQTALVSPELTLSYEQLYKMANRIGRWLRQAGCSRGNLVAIVMEKGWEQIAAVWGIIIGGGAYLPLDPGLPDERLLELITESRVKLVLTQPRIAGQLNLPADLPVKSISRDVCSDFAETGLEYNPEPNDLVYLLYTSGSTGKPKGVMIEQQSIVNRMLDVIERFSITPDDKVLALTALHHDLSVFDIFGTLLAGATIIVPDRSQTKDPFGWAHLIDQQGVTIWNSVPAFLEMLTEYLVKTKPPPPTISSLRLVLLSGDWIPPGLPDQVRSVNPQTRVISLGGPTETTVWDICYPITKVNPAWHSIPYGRPMRNARYFILNDALEACPVWVTGEIHIAGTGLARGYWRDENKTREKFILHPKTGERLYRSGDLGRYNPEGYIEIIGRKDSQFKINGWRIEPGEIEETLKQFPDIRQAVVVPRQKSGRNTGLVAFLVLRSSDEDGETGKNISTETPVQPVDQNTHYNPRRSDLNDREQMVFKLEHPGIRTDLESLSASDLNFTEGEAERRERFYRRQSVRTFSNQLVTRHQLSELLSCLSGYQSTNSLIPKFRYPSAGNLQPVQCYLHIASGRVEDLAAGTYYYHPAKHGLIHLSNSEIPNRCHLTHNAGICREAAFSIFLIGQMAAIEPIYGELTRDFCLLEAGCMTQLLMSEAPACGLGLCPIGDLDFKSVRHLFRLADTHSFLHCIVGGNSSDSDQVSGKKCVKSNGQPNGLPDACRKTPETAERMTEIREFLTGKLPGYLIPNNFVFLDSLPINANGKIDRQALSEMTEFQSEPVRKNASAVQVVGLNDIERKLVEIWSEVLETDEISVTANFGEMGADSIHLVRVMQQLNPFVDRDLSITDLFRYSNIRALAEFIGTASQDINNLREGEQRAKLRTRLRGRKKDHE